MNKSSQTIRIPVFDGHNDTLKKLFLGAQNSLYGRQHSQVTISRAKRGGLAGAFFALLTVAEKREHRKFGFGLKLTEHSWEVAYPDPLRPEYAARFTDDLIEFAEDIVRRTPEVRIVKTFDDLLYNWKNELISIVLQFEGADAIRDDLSNLEHYYEKGLRLLGLVWSRSNAFGSGAPFRFPSSPDIGDGLTDAGRALVRACNEMGIMIDLAHINQKGFFDVAGISHAPLIVSHTGVHAICPSATNLTDTQIEMVGDSGGIIGIIFDVLNTRPDGKLISDTSIHYIIRHIDYVVEKIGIDHVGLGSDFDGGQMSDHMRDCSCLPLLLHALKDRGYQDDALSKIAYRNWFRVMQETWR